MFSFNLSFAISHALPNPTMLATFSVHTQKASHVLKAMGFNHEQITGSLRISFGYTNTLNEVDQAVEVLKKVVSELRSVSPYKTKYNF